jgi:HTH-type transcriptional regulator / antitoxin HigA
MPTAYEELLLETKPEIIETREQYQSVLRRVTALTRAGRRRTPVETKLFRLLSLLIQDYDRRHALPPDEASPAERLGYLMEVSGKTAADLLAAFGQNSRVKEAISGKRQITADQARKLGEIFHLNPGYFV